MFEGSIPRVGGPYFLHKHQIWWRYLDRWRRRYAPKIEFYTRFQCRHDIVSSMRPAYVWSYEISAKWHRLVTVPNALLTKPSVPFLSQWAKCRHGNTHNGGTVLQIANLMADSESRSPEFYSNFLVTMHLSRLVSEIGLFACDRQTVRQTDIVAVIDSTGLMPLYWLLNSFS